MRKWVIIYKELPATETGHQARAYLKADGDYSYDPKDAKMHAVRNWIEFALKILLVIIRITGTGHKYQIIK